VTHRHAYFHGFASSPDSRKGNRLAREFASRGIPFWRPDMNAPSFGRLTVTAMMGVVGALDAAEGARATWRVVGSSLGGFLAALWASRNPDRVDRLVLLCPAFDMRSRWPGMIGAANMERWRAEGTLPMPDHAGVPTPVHWGLMDDLSRWPAVPEAPCPTLVIHGVDDETVPIDSSRAYASLRPHVRLIEVRDGHLLADSMDRIVEEVVAFFEL
jgi:pimeloyl-ACP methyl ester carboxylesterase